MARRELYCMFNNDSSELIYIVEKKDWSIKWDGKYITNSLNAQNLIKAEVGYKKQGKIAKNKIVHFGSRNIYLPDAYRAIHKSNKIVFTWFHGTDEDINFIKALPASSRYASYVHTSCRISEQNLIGWGVDESKIKVIPLGVDIDHFKPISLEDKIKRRKQVGIPDDKFVVCSVQKDGVGWTDGLEPKLIKGPDIFCDTVIALNKIYPLHVLLVGPARGYVKKRLDDVGITYSHFHLDNFLDVAWYYPLSDLCLITSRAEGGPKALLESMASGIPVVSSKVGMCADVIRHGENGMLADIGDVCSLVDSCCRLIENESEREHLALQGLSDVKEYSWDKIAMRYYNEMYRHLL